MAYILLLNGQDDRFDLPKFASNKPLGDLKPESVYDAVRIEVRRKYQDITISKTPTWNPKLNQWEGTCEHLNTRWKWVVAE